MADIIRVEGLTGGYGASPVIKDISFGIERGDFVGIIGPNGSGKSTLLRFLTRVLTPKQGAIYFEERDIHGIRLKELFRNIAFVPQDTVINFSYSVWEIVLMGRIPHLGRLELETKRDFAIAEKALLFTDSRQFKDSKVNELSAGERQRVLIAKALAQEPRLIFLDEPTSHLDIGHQIEILSLLKRLNREEGLTIVIVLHDLNLASEYCNRLILLERGSINTQGSPFDVLTYQNIERVYKTVVVVRENPFSRKPYIILISK